MGSQVSHEFPKHVVVKCILIIQHSYNIDGPSIWMIYNDLPIEHSDFPHAKFPEILASQISILAPHQWLARQRFTRETVGEEASRYDCFFLGICPMVRLIFLARSCK